MKGLIVKDFSLLAQRGNTLIIFLGACILMSFSTESSFAAGYTSILGAIIALSTISYDEADNGLIFLMTLPVSRRTYADSKYVLGALMCGAAWVASIVMALMVGLIKGEGVNLTENLIAATACLPAAMMMLNLMIPVQLKYGAEKSRIVLIAVFGGLTALGAGLMKMNILDTDAVEALFARVETLSLPVLLAAALGVFAAVTAVSILASRHIMEKKRF